MVTQRFKILLAATMILAISALTMSVLAQAGEAEAQATAVIQYKLVPIPSPITQAQLQSILTTQGNGGWRLLGPYAVGTGPIPTQEVLAFSKP
ncbi:MAG TPA: hypothetical protein VGS22_24300 [Thermoanaerobaculia bacterium]|jgi:hypothetical protein|nr:hypothetical protein [Thermoanaerobaculia bacterium]